MKSALRSDRISARITRKMHRDMDVACKEKKWSESKLIEAALEKYLYPAPEDPAPIS